MKDTYNLKVKEYSEQTVISLYDKPIAIRDNLENAIIQIKKYRNANGELVVDNGDGTGTYISNSIYLDAEIKMTLFDLDLEQYYDYVCFLVRPLYYKDIESEDEKAERSLLASLSRTKQKIYDIAYSNNWDMFITLTFDDEKLIKKYGNAAWDYDTCTKALHSFFTVLKRNYPDIQYLGVPELHHNYYDVVTCNVVLHKNRWFTDEDYNNLLKKTNLTQEEKDLIFKVQNGEYKRRFHFHFLFNNFPFSQLVDSGERTKGGDIIYNLLNYKLGFTTCTLIKSVQASQHYITKYISKDLISLSQGKKRYWASKNLNKPLEHNEFLYEDEIRDLKSELVDSIKSDTRIKELKVENGSFENTIYKYVIKDWEGYKNTTINKYSDIDDRIKILDIPGQIKDLDKWLNTPSPFNPFARMTSGYFRYRNVVYRFYNVNGNFRYEPA